MKANQSSRKILLFLAFVVLALAGTALAEPKFKVLHAFGDNEGGLYGSLVLDQSGNLYGTERAGGAYGLGAVFKLTQGKDGLWARPYSTASTARKVRGALLRRALPSTQPAICMG